MTTSTETTSAPTSASLASWLSLAVLLISTLYTYADRQIFALQAEPLRKALELSDLQFGLLQGLGHAIFAAIVGYPIAWLSDRFDRRVVLAGCLALWSATVMASGFAGSFTQLFLATSLVGAAEAGMLPIVYALVPELFSGKQRQYANSALVVAGRLLVGLVIAACGWLIFAIDQWRPTLPEALRSLDTWRVSFLLVGATGLIFVPAVLLVKMSSDRPKVQGLSDTPARASVWPFVREQRAAFASFMMSVGLLVFGFGATGAFIPVIATRQMGMSPMELGNAMGLATFAAAAVGLAVANAGLGPLTKRYGALLPVRVLTIAALGSGIFAAALPLARNPVELFVIMGLHQCLLMAGTMLFPTALQEMTPAPMRARLIALVIMFNIILASLSPVVVGALSDALKPRPEGLMWAMACTSATALLLAALSIWLCGRRYVGTVQAARSAETA
jgi:MFS family permease